LQIDGMSNYVSAIGILNVSKCFEIAMNDGIDPATGAQVGQRTGDFRELKTFDEVMAAFLRQMEYFCELEATLNEKDILDRRNREGYTLRTLFTRGCIESGKAFYHGGPKYNNIELECIGITNTADSLAGIKKAVFDDKKTTMAGLMDALSKNFDSYGDLHHYLMNTVPKFGNDDIYVDSIRTEITDFIFRKFNQRKSLIGGIFMPGEVIFIVHEEAGKAVGATPDGRSAGTVLADSAGAAQGMDKAGPTALMNSVRRIPTDYALTSVVLNIRFMKRYFRQPESAERMKDMLKSFLANGGMQVQVNVFDAETLKEAEADPKKFASLIVRVGGFSDYYVRLSPDLRAEILKRTEYAGDT